MSETFDTELAARIEHTILRPDATAEDVAATCAEALAWHCAGVCVNSNMVVEARRAMGPTGLVVATIGFPFGVVRGSLKAWEADLAVQDGAQEIDMVVNLGFLKAGDWKAVCDDVATVQSAIGDSAKLKVIVETGALTRDEKIQVGRMLRDMGIDYIKTSTGYFKETGATVEDVALFKNLIKGYPGVKIKASGGIHTYDQAQMLVAAGADRLGMSKTQQVLFGVNSPTLGR